MVPTVVIIKLISTPITMITITPATLTQNSPTPLTGKITVVWSPFGVYRHTMIGSSEVSNRTLVPISASVESYCKVLIAKIFFL